MPPFAKPRKIWVGRALPVWLGGHFQFSILQSAHHAGGSDAGRRRPAPSRSRPAPAPRWPPARLSFPPAPAGPTAELARAPVPRPRCVTGKRQRVSLGHCTAARAGGSLAMGGRVLPECARLAQPSDRDPPRALPPSCSLLPPSSRRVTPGADRSASAAPNRALAGGEETSSSIL